MQLILIQLRDRRINGKELENSFKIEGKKENYSVKLKKKRELMDIESLENDTRS